MLMLTHMWNAKMKTIKNIEADRSHDYVMTRWDGLKSKSIQVLTIRGSLSAEDVKIMFSWSVW